MGFLLYFTRKYVASAFRAGNVSRLSAQCANRGLAVAASDSAIDTENAGVSGENVLDPLIVCGPSGVGKGTIIERFMANEIGSNNFGFTTSHTTRSPREGEVDGIHYNFVEYDDMKRLIEMGKFLEHAEVHGNFYGTSWDSLWKVQNEGRRCLLDIDVQGVKRAKSLEHTNNELNTGDMASSRQFKPKYVFIAPPSMELLEQRLIGRGTEDAESLKRRTQNAREEVEYGMQEGMFDHVLVNDDLDVAVKEFERLVKDLYGLWR